MGDLNENWVTDQAALTLPNAARMYDYFLGGFHNFEVDRRAAEQIQKLQPLVDIIARGNRAFVRRAVRFLCDEGIDQFLDIGSGIPTVGNVHEIAQRHLPGARVVYVDIDPVAVEHSLALLQDNEWATAIRADVREPETILEDPAVLALLDFDRPLGLLMTGMMYFIVDDELAYRSVATMRKALAPGSYLALSHTSRDGSPSPHGERISEMYEQARSPVRSRSHEEVLAFFEGLELVEPGLVWVPQWRPDSDEELMLDRPTESGGYAGVGRKP
jgi:hypothetical protein